MDAAVTDIVMKQRGAFLSMNAMCPGGRRGVCLGPRGLRIEVPITNAQERQTDYGALNLLTGRAFTYAAATGNSEHTVTVVNHLRQRVQGRPVLLVWDGASYHRSGVVKAYLQKLNGNVREEEWRMTCLRFASHAPEQNPMKDVWLRAKTHVRRLWYALKTFSEVKWYFTTFLESHRFEFEKLNWYGRLQLI